MTLAGLAAAYPTTFTVAAIIILGSGLGLLAWAVERLWPVEDDSERMRC